MRENIYFGGVLISWSKNILRCDIERYQTYIECKVVPTRMKRWGRECVCFILQEGMMVGGEDMSRSLECGEASF